jgi:hypothetical protein
VTVIGSPEEWGDFIDSQIPDILALVIDSWTQMASPASDALEDRITEALCRVVKSHRAARELPLQIHLQPVEIEPAEGQEVGRMDIAFYPLVNREDIYFCLEAKRLNVLKDRTVRPNASEYVRFGMMRFITGQYAKLARNGGMIGYVVDGRVPHAIANVAQNIRNRHLDLGMTPPGELLTSTILTGEPRARETHHTRRHDSSSFRIHHLFMTKKVSAN